MNPETIGITWKIYRGGAGDAPLCAAEVVVAGVVTACGFSMKASRAVSITSILLFNSLSLLSNSLSLSQSDIHHRGKYPSNHGTLDGCPESSGRTILAW